MRSSYLSMMAVIPFALFVACLVASVNCSQAKKEKNYAVDEQQRDIYTASWAVEITEGGKKMADVIANRHGFINVGKIAGLNNIYRFELTGYERSHLKKDFPYTSKSDNLQMERCIGLVQQQVVKQRVRKSFTVATDPLFHSQWNILNTGQYGIDFQGNDLNVERAWLQGVTGCNVTVTVVDDGIDFRHRDLWNNYSPQTSYNFVEDHSDPSTNYPWHGTSCGGIIGSSKNTICSVGIAYEANLGSVALLGGNSDMNEASSLTFKNDIVDVYSNSWGPFDSGDIVEGPEELTRLALQSGANNGRNGKGSIYVWANGNGGEYDDCAADGYTQSIYTISVGAIGVDGNPSWFDEECSAKMVTAFVTDLSGFSAVTTTSLGGECTTSFGGTSAATPMVSGVIALALEVNANLSWRDVQYLTTYTSNPLLTNTTNSIYNGAGLLVSHEFGFGVIDAEAMVTRARHWINVPSQLKDIVIPDINSGASTIATPFTTAINYSATLRYLEHVVVSMTVTATTGNRGDIRIELTSPSGTSSTLLSHRDSDFSSDGYFNWQFMSVMFWGEDPTGEWSLSVITRSSTEASVSDVEFQFYGVSSVPESVANIPDECHSDCRRGCAQEGSEFCDACVNLRNAYTLECIDTCPLGYTERNGYCYDGGIPTEECSSPLKHKEGGSCADAGFIGCCIDENCEVTNPTFLVSCYCDALCYLYDDCCDDIDVIECYQQDITQEANNTKFMPYITLGVTDGVTTQSVPPNDDGISLPIDVTFPFGSQLQTTVYVGTNGYFTFEVYTDYSPFLFHENISYFLVAPFFTDIDISQGVGQIDYEIHTEITSLSLLSEVSLLINEHVQTDFNGEWLLVATWDNVPPYGDNGITNTFQGMIITDFQRSFSVFTYYCGHLNYSNGATVGFVAGDGLFANHPASQRGSVQSIACSNSPSTPWVNVVYEITKTENECLVDNGGCEQICSETFVSFICSCTTGYSLANDGYSCIDDNECATSSDNDCQHICINTLGSYMCECRDSYTSNDDGRTCSPSCGGILTETSGSFHTPDWPNSYPSLDYRCEWVIDIENMTDAVIEITFNEPYGIRSNGPCPTDYVEVLDGIQQDSDSLGKYCNTQAPDPILTTSTQATVIFQASTFPHGSLRVGVSVSYSILQLIDECESGEDGCKQICIDTLKSYTCSCNDGYILHNDKHKCIDMNECSATGHGCSQLCYNTDGSYNCGCREGYSLNDDGKTCSLSCGGILTETSGSFHTPDWPNSYPSLDYRCEWMIDIENMTDAVIEITFNEPYGIRNNGPCPTDYVEVLDGIQQDSDSLGKYCNKDAPDPIVTTSTQATVIFQASTFPHGSLRVGVSMSYRTVQ